LNWSQTASGIYHSVEISPVNHNVVYAGTTTGLYRSVDGGQNWSLYNNSFTPSHNVIGVSMDAASGDTVIAATNDAVYKVWGSMVGIEKITTEVPDKFSLSQNYPNPFTKIKFEIPSVGATRRVALTIYDILGREVVTLVNEQLQPGVYSVDWNASDFASGIYFYSLVVGDNTNKGGFNVFSQTRKMVLVK